MIRERLIQNEAGSTKISNHGNTSHVLTDEVADPGTLCAWGVQTEAPAMVQELTVQIERPSGKIFFLLSCDGGRRSRSLPVSGRTFIVLGIPGVSEFFTETANLPALWANSF